MKAWHLRLTVPRWSCKVGLNEQLQRPKSRQASPRKTRFVDVPGRRLAYRTFGSGKPVVLCVRFRGTMDAWDPLSSIPWQAWASR